MSRASRLRQFQKTEAGRIVTRERQNRRADLLQWCEGCQHCGRALQSIDANEVDYACLDRRNDRLLCRGCIGARVHLVSMESGATQ